MNLKFKCYYPNHINLPYFVAAALRFCRKIIGAKDEFYNRYITKGKLLAPIVKSFEENGDKYNMINSAIIELFEFIKVVSDYSSDF